MLRNNGYLVLVSLVMLGSLSSVWVIPQAGSLVDSTGATDGTKSTRILAHNYLVASATTGENRAKAFSALSLDDKTRFLKLHLALQLAKRPYLTKEQRQVIVDGIATANSHVYESLAVENQKRTVTYGRALERRIRILFHRGERTEIFDPLTGDSASVRMLQSYQRITELPFASKRRATFRELSPQAKSETFRTHLAAQIAIRSLSKDQVGFIAKGLPLFSDRVYESGVKSHKEHKGIDDWLRALNQQSLAYFPKEEAADIFASLGGLRDDAVQIKSVFLRGPSSDDAFLDAPEIVYDEAPICSCSTQSDWCNFWYGHNAYCKEREGNSCIGTTGGCGTGMAYECNGVCHVPWAD